MLLAFMLGLSACQSNKQDAAFTSEVSPSDAYLYRDVRDDVFYFVMPDRFNNGDTSNDEGSEHYAISRGGLDKTSKWAFHGGDIKGLEQKLDYLQNLGITAIWMTPILRNKAVQKDGFAHHGYWTVDFTSLDPHFGTNAELKSLIDAAHAKGMKVFFDIITNHTADVIKFSECHAADGTGLSESGRCPYKSLKQVASGDQYTPFVPAAEQGLKVPSWLNDPAFYHNQGNTTFEGESSLNGDFSGLDDLNTEHPRVLSGMIEIYQNIIQEFRPDGFRIDTVRHVRMPFWQEFGPAIVSYAQELGIPNFHIFGEVYDSDPAALSQFTTVGKLPSVLDFGFQEAAAQVFYQGKNPNILKRLFAQDYLYQDDDSQADLLMTFLGNHDMGRPGLFINQAQPNGSPDEYLKRSILSHAFMFFSRGIPIIYYGDEQGFTGDGNDVDAREDMFPSLVASYNDNSLIGSSASVADDNFDQTHPLYQALKELSDMRLQHKTLRYGQFRAEYFSESSMVFAFSRTIERGEDLMMIFNAGASVEQIEFEPFSRRDQNAGYQKIAGEGNFKDNGEVVTASLPPLSFMMLKDVIKK